MIKISLIVYISVLVLLTACSVNETTSLKEKSDQDCTDTDDGRTYNVKGKLNANAPDEKLIIKEDACRVYADEWSGEGGYQTVEEGTHLIEWSCDLAPQFSEVIECPNGCKNGACI